MTNNSQTRPNRYYPMENIAITTINEVQYYPMREGYVIEVISGDPLDNYMARISANERQNSNYTLACVLILYGLLIYGIIYSIIGDD